MAKDMTQGNLVKNLVYFSLPLILSGLLQQLYNWADAFIVGNVEGELQLAAIGATTSISNFLITIITGFSVGVSILAAYLHGGGEDHQIDKVLSSFTFVLGGAFLLLGVLGTFFAKTILQFLQTPEDIFSTAHVYIRIIFAGIPFITVYNIYAAVLRGMGNSQIPFLAILVSSFSNILLDILLVVLFRYGATGAAIATVVSQALMTIFIVCYATRKYPSMLFSIRKNPVDRKILHRGFRLSLPTAIQSSAHSTGSLLLQNFMNGFGTQTVAAITTAYRIDAIILLPIINLGAGISTVVAQNTGAGNHDRAKKGLYAGLAIMAIVSVILTLTVIPFGGALISIFGVSEEAVAIGRNFFRIIAVFYLPFGIATAFKGFLEGAGDVIFSGIASIIALFLRIFLSYTYSSYGNSIIAYAEATSWIALLLMCMIRFVWFYRKKRY